MAPPIRAIRWDGQEVTAGGAPLSGARISILKADGNAALVWADPMRLQPLPYVNSRWDGSWTAYLDPGIYTVSPAGGVAYGIQAAVGVDANREAELVSDGSHFYVGESTMLRRDVSTQTQPLTSQSMMLTYFTAVKTEPITQVRTFSGSTAAAATPTVCRVGVFSVDGAGAGTLLAAIANDTTLWAATTTAYTRSLTTTWNKVAGQRYAVGLLCVTGTTAPTVSGGATQLTNPEYFDEPRLTGSITGQADLPATFTAAAPVSIGRAGIYVRFLP